MKTSTFEKVIPMLPRVGACLIALTGALLIGDAGCNQADQGDRCNPLRSSNECNGGLVCAGNPIGQSATAPIPFCPENYCCPANADGTVDFGSATSPYCQPGCNGGAAALCAAMAADAEACTVANCLADASDPSSCLPEEGGEAPGDAGGVDGATSDSEAGSSEAGSSEAGPSEAGPTEAGPSEAGPVEAAAEAATTSSDGSTDGTTE